MCPHMVMAGADCAMAGMQKVGLRAAQLTPTRTTWLLAVLEHGEHRVGLGAPNSRLDAQRTLLPGAGEAWSWTLRCSNSPLGAVAVILAVLISTMCSAVSPAFDVDARLLGVYDVRASFQESSPLEL